MAFPNRTSLQKAVAKANDPSALLKESGFFDVTDVGPNYRLIVCSRANPKHGKTTFSLTAPGPIAYIDYDQGSEGVINRFIVEGKKILKCDMPKPVVSPKKTDYSKKPAATAESESKEADQQEDTESKSRHAQYNRYWLKGRDAFCAALDSGIIRTVVVDTATEFYESLRLARFGKLTEVLPHQYGPVKQEFRDVIRQVLTHPTINANFIHKMKKEYKGSGKNGNWTGNWEMQGFEDMGYIAQVIITHLREIDDTTGKNRYGIRVDDCRQNGEAMNEELWSDMGMCNWASLGQLVFPESTELDWE